MAGPLLGVNAGWELYGRGDGVVVRVALARGRITRTTVPTLSSSGPVSFIAGNGWALVRPIDFVPGYLIPDGQPARSLTGALGDGGPAFPGPDPNHVWVPVSGDEPNRMVLVGTDGRRTGLTLPIPAGSSPLSAIPDQTGYVLYPDIGTGAYDTRPDHSSRISPGTVLAVGPTRWLISECDRRHRCTTMLINRSTGARRELDTAPVRDGVLPGAISPDGTMAALLVRSPSPAIETIDLATGTAHTLSPHVNLSTANEQSLVWSPDSRWVFATGASGDVYAVNAGTGQITDLTDITGRALPPLSQIAIRAAPAN
ncbi:MAG: hypothetical protein ACRDWT_08950 [Jatrophihabitantaceae bacterium]